MVDLDHWRAFVKVVECGSFARAAVQMRVARSAVSRRVSELEAHLGANLVRRSTRHLSITETGEAFFERARQLLAEFDELEAQTIRGHTDARGHIRLAAPLSFTVRHLTPIIEQFRRRYPGVTFEINLADRRVDLVSEGFDFALRIGSEMEESLVARRLCTIRHVVAASPEYLALRGRPARPQELVDHTILAYSNLPKPRVWSFLSREDDSRCDVRFEPALMCDNGEFLLACARRGDGIVCEPSFLLHEDLAAGRLVPLLPTWQWRPMNAFLVYPAHRRVPSRVRMLMDTLANALTDPPTWDEPIAASLPDAP